MASSPASTATQHPNWCSGCLRASVGTHKGARGPRINGGNGPWPYRPHPLVEVTRMCGLSGCGYPHVRLVMHVLNCSRHAAARPKSSRQIDELLDELLVHRSRAGRPRGSRQAQSE